LGLYFGLFGLFAWLFALGGFLPLNIRKKLLLWAFGVGSFWEGKELLKGKIAEGKMLRRGL
jgi:hypothetical protein